MSRWFSVTSQLLQKLLAPLVSQFSHQAPLSSGNSAPWLSTCVFLQAASINNMLTSPCRSSQRLQASKHLQLFGTHLSITTMNPWWPKLRLPAATWAAETNSLPERWFFFFFSTQTRSLFESATYWLAKNWETLCQLLPKQKKNAQLPECTAVSAIRSHTRSHDCKFSTSWLVKHY